VVKKKRKVGKIQERVISIAQTEHKEHFFETI
jgi:hypothetical protein